MAEYIKVDGRDGNTIIDDDYRCYHLVGKYVKTNSDVYAPTNLAFETSGLIFAHDIVVKSIVQPVVATTDCCIFSCDYQKISEDQWKVTIYWSTVGNFGFVSKLPKFSFTFFVYGLVDEYEKVYGEPVVEVFNAKGKLVFSSALKYLKPVLFFSRIMYDVEPEFFSYYGQKPYLIKIPNYQQQKKYAVIPCSSAHTYQSFDGGGLRQTNISGLKVEGASVRLSMIPAGQGYLNDILDAFVPTLSVMVVDVTGL